MRITLLTSILLGLSACYAPDLSRVHYRCVEAAPLCPAGQSCIAGCCGGPPCGDSPTLPPGDMAGTTVPADMLIPAAPGCKSGQGRVISSTMHACPGIFGVGTSSSTPASLCAPGWSWCSTNTAGSACQDAVPSTELYLAMAPQAQSTPYPWQAGAACSWSGVGTSGLRGLGGCGNGQPGLSGPPGVQPCGGFPLVAICWESGARYPGSPIACPWSMASDGDLSGLVNVSPAVGVLCCQP